MIHKRRTIAQGVRHMISILLSVLLVLTMGICGDGNYCGFYGLTVKAEETGSVPAGVTNVNVRENPSTSAKVITKVQGGQSLTIIDKSTAGWYKVTFVKDSTSYTGYISASYVQINSAQVPSDNPSSDTDFENALSAQGFPESYKVYLRAIHQQHPEWKFVAVNTGLDWNSVLSHECNMQGQIKNLVQGTASAPHYNWRETSVGYNWATDTWYPYDGTSWFAASKELLAYYMDPRTYLDETYIFAFEQLSYDSSIHTAAGVEAILSGTFMSNAVPTGESVSYSTLIMNAAAATGVSPYHLASRIKQEMGSTAGVNATGRSSAYPGIYNYYNIGATDSSGGGAVNKGLAWAANTSVGTYGRPWTSVSKSITGGAEYIGSSYINRGQDTLYTQKYNVTYTANLYSHQYMTNLQAPASEASVMYRAYKNNGLLNAALVFKIPVYANMPEQAAGKPADSGSPNNWLKTLEITGCALTPTYTGATTEYSVIVDASVASVTVTATTVNAYARIAGIGTINLQYGENKIPITVTAQNGKERVYTITVVRKNEDGSISTLDPSSGDSLLLNTNYTVRNSTISGINPGTTVADFVNALGATGCTVTISKPDGVPVSEGKIGTGMIVTVVNGGTTEIYTCILYGDVSGDGMINALDLLKVQKHIIGASKLEGNYLTAANVKKSGSVSALDLLKIQKHIIGASQLPQ